MLSGKREELLSLSLERDIFSQAPVHRFISFTGVSDQALLFFFVCLSIFWSIILFRYGDFTFRIGDFGFRKSDSVHLDRICLSILSLFRYGGT